MQAFQLDEALKESRTYKKALNREMNGAGRKDASLREQIRIIILDPDLKGFDKKRSVAETTRKYLEGQGAFYRTSDERMFFFSHNERQLYDIEQRIFSHLLVEESGLSTTETFFKFMIDTLTANVARQGKLVEVHTLAHYDTRTQVLIVSDGGGGIWRRERGGQWEAGKNGDDNILFLTEPEATPWRPQFSEENHLQWLLDQINFCPTPLSLEDQRAFLLCGSSTSFFRPFVAHAPFPPGWVRKAQANRPHVGSLAVSSLGKNLKSQGCERRKKTLSLQLSPTASCTRSTTLTPA
jgi:hypothetical protein